MSITRHFFFACVIKLENIWMPAQDSKYLSAPFAAENPRLKKKRHYSNPANQTCQEPCAIPNNLGYSASGSQHTVLKTNAAKTPSGERLSALLSPRPPSLPHGERERLGEEEKSGAKAHQLREDAPVTSVWLGGKNWASKALSTAAAGRPDFAPGAFLAFLQPSVASPGPPLDTHTCLLLRLSSHCLRGATAARALSVALSQLAAKSNPGPAARPLAFQVGGGVGGVWGEAEGQQQLRRQARDTGSA